MHRSTEFLLMRGVVINSSRQRFELDWTVRSWIKQLVSGGMELPGLPIVLYPVRQRERRFVGDC
ncbi:MAG: hypothetical protein OXB95_04065, partial [Rhodobacteraceae bacterium]|nr:hypothetical protein [Paracoccaceae bacterium]